MLDTLSVELIGRVQALLAAADLRALRLVARVFDVASREHTLRAAAVTLAPSSVPNAPAWPELARFPRLRRLVLRDWRVPADCDLLRSLLGARGATRLACLQEVDGTHWTNDLGADTWRAILQRAPSVSKLRLGSAAGHCGLGCHVLSAIADDAPRLAELQLDFDIDTTAAGLIAARMPALRALSARGLRRHRDGAGGPGGEENKHNPWSKAAAWHELPCSILTALSFSTCDLECLPKFDREPFWPHMRRLSGIVLPADCAEAVARGLPNLQWLHASPQGDWRQEGGTAAFQSVGCLHLFMCCESFSTAARLSRLFPSVERLEWDSGDGPIGCKFSGLTRLTHLELYLRRGYPVMSIQPRVWEALPQLTCLRHLALDLTHARLPELARLPPSLEALRIRVAPNHAFDLCGVMRAAALAPGVRVLCVCAPSTSVSQISAAPLLATLPLLGRVRHLQILSPPLDLNEASALATLPGLRRLLFRPALGLAPTEPPLLSLIADHARLEGLEVAVAGEVAFGEFQPAVW